MQKEPTSRVQKLILLVLVGILACLIVIIAQNRARNGSEDTLNSEAAVSSMGTDEETVEPVPEPQPIPAPPVRVAISRNTATIGSGFAQHSDGSRVTVLNNPTQVEPLPEIQALAVVEARRASVASRTFTPPVAAVSGSHSSGRIGGAVFLRGAPPPEIQIPLPEGCASLNPGGATTRHYLVSPQGGFANVLVYVKQGLDHLTFPVPKDPVIIDAVGCFFQPYISVAQAGQTIRFRNLDPFLRNVHATPKMNKEWNFALVVQGQANDWKFNTPELFIRFKDDRYEWAFSYLTVLKHPFAAVTDSEGNYQLPPGLPAGTYTLAAHHLKAGELTQRITIGHSEARPIDFTFEIPARLSGL